MRRMWDLTYRVNAGALKYAAGSVRTASEPIVSAENIRPKALMETFTLETLTAVYTSFAGLLRANYYHIGS